MVLYDEFCFLGWEPPPFIHLTKHILSISANSASCERLFSIFGNILTKLQNRLGVNNMVILAKLKMHIHDEHTHKQTKKRLKWVFQIHTDAERAAAALAVPSQPSMHAASLQQTVYPEATANSPEESEASDDDNNNDAPQPRGSSNQHTSCSQLMNSF